MNNCVKCLQEHIDLRDVLVGKQCGQVCLSCYHDIWIFVFTGIEEPSFEAILEYGKYIEIK